MLATAATAKGRLAAGLGGHATSAYVPLPSIGRPTPPGGRSRARAAPRPQRRQHRPYAAAPTTQVTEAGSKAKQFRTASELPSSLRNATAVLQTAEGASVYVLGISHVSKESCQQIEQLIGLVQPDIVLLELCKDRSGLLVDPDAPQPQTWYTPRITISGLPPGAASGAGAAAGDAAGWPTAAELAGLLKGRGCSPVSAADIEDDAVALLATGLFRSVRVAAKPPAASAAPAFVLPSGGGGGGLQTVAPLGEIEFVTPLRLLPAIQELAFRADGGVALPAEEAMGRARAAATGAGAAPAGAATSAAAAAPAGVSGYLRVRRALLEGLPQDVDVVFEGVEGGRPTAVLRPVPSGQHRCLTGLEGTATGGVGPYIEPFKRQAVRRQQPPASSSSSNGGSSSGIQLGAATKQQQGGSSSSSSLDASRLSSEQFTQLLPWNQQQLAAAAEAGAGSSGGGGSGNALASFLTTTYSKYQGQAGRSVGIAPGEAWRVALRAAVAAGASQVHLGDLPADTTGQRLADAILSSSLPLLLGSLVASVASAIVISQGLLDSGAPASPLAVAAAATLPVALALAPVVAPLVEVARFAGMSGSQIEDTVRLKEPLQAASLDAPLVKLWGEDALLSWPGAMDPIIASRDAYMARSIAAAVSGRPEGLTPAYVLTRAAGSAAGDGASSSGGAAVLQYAMPVGGEAGACPPGVGAGQYAPLPGPRTVVAVVGTAHVRGMIREWQAAQRDTSLRPLL